MDEYGAFVAFLSLVLGGWALAVWRLERREYARAIERRLSSWPGKP